MATYYIDLPCTIDKIDQLKLGDLVYLTGMICTGRDQVHRRIIDFDQNHKNLPQEFHSIKAAAIYHMGPIVKKAESGAYSIVSGGPTTSDRMGTIQSQVCNILDLRFVIGKGGMNTAKWSSAHAVYLAFPGGVGALAAKFLKDVKSVVWLDLGIPEAAWFIQVKNFGPLVVAIDSQGHSLYP